MAMPSVFGFWFRLGLMMGSACDLTVFGGFRCLVTVLEVDLAGVCSRFSLIRRCAPPDLWGLVFVLLFLEFKFGWSGPRFDPFHLF